MTKKINSPEFNDIMTFTPPRRLVCFVILISIAIFSLIFMLFFYNRIVTVNFDFSNIIVVDSQRNVVSGIVNNKNVKNFPENYEVLLINDEIKIPAVIEEANLNYEQSTILKIKLCPDHEYEDRIDEEKEYSIQITQRIPLYRYIMRIQS